MDRRTKALLLDRLLVPQGFAWNLGPEGTFGVEVWFSGTFKEMQVISAVLGTSNINVVTDEGYWLSECTFEPSRTYLDVRDIDWRTLYNKVFPKTEEG